MDTNVAELSVPGRYSLGRLRGQARHFCLIDSGLGSTMISSVKSRDLLSTMGFMRSKVQRTYLKVLEDLYNMTAISDRSKAIPERVDRDPGTALSRS